MEHGHVTAGCITHVSALTERRVQSRVQIEHGCSRDQERLLSFVTYFEKRRPPKRRVGDVSLLRRQRVPSLAPHGANRAIAPKALDRARGVGSALGRCATRLHRAFPACAD